MAHKCRNYDVDNKPRVWYTYNVYTFEALLMEG